MLPFHNEPLIRENIIAKILFASCLAKFSYREKFRVYGSLWHTNVLLVCSYGKLSPAAGALDIM